MFYDECFLGNIYKEGMLLGYEMDIKGFLKPNRKKIFTAIPLSILFGSIGSFLGFCPGCTISTLQQFFVYLLLPSQLIVVFISSFFQFLLQASQPDVVPYVMAVLVVIQLIYYYIVTCLIFWLLDKRKRVKGKNKDAVA